VEITVNGKKVVLRDKVEARYFDAVMQLVDAVTDTTRKKLSFMPIPLTFEELVALGRIAVLSWEFEGDPKDAESWASLDLPEELIPLVVKMSEWLGAKFKPPKN
jgi:hypothetical protein